MTDLWHGAAGLVLAAVAGAVVTGMVSHACTDTSPRSASGQVTTDAGLQQQNRDLQATIAALRQQLDQRPPAVTVTVPVPQPVQTVIVTVTVPAVAPQAATAPPRTAATTASRTSTNDTPDGTVLDIGQSWKHDGLELAILNPNLQPNGLTFTWQLINKRTTNTVFHFTNGDAFS